MCACAREGHVPTQTKHTHTHDVPMYVRMSVWMYGWIYGMIYGWMDWWIDGWTDGSMDGRMDGWKDGCKYHTYVRVSVSACLCVCVSVLCFCLSVKTFQSFSVLRHSPQDWESIVRHTDCCGSFWKGRDCNTRLKRCRFQNNLSQPQNENDVAPSHPSFMSFSVRQNV